MNRKTLNKLSMYKAVLAICSQHQSEWSTLPAFEAALVQFSAKLPELEQSTYKQGILTLGVTATKEQLRKETAELADLVAQALRAYAAGTDNLMLTEQLHFPKQDLVRSNGQLLLNRIDYILELADLHSFGALDYGLTAQHITDLMYKRTLLGDSLGQPRAAIINRKEQTAAIATLTDQLDDLLKNHLDRMAEVLKPTYPVFWKHYRDARIIVDYKGKKGGEDEDEAPGLPDGTDDDDNDGTKS